MDEANSRAMAILSEQDRHDLFSSPFVLARSWVLVPISGNMYIGFFYDLHGSEQDRRLAQVGARKKGVEKT